MQKKEDIDICADILKDRIVEMLKDIKDHVLLQRIYRFVKRLYIYRT